MAVQNDSDFLWLNMKELHLKDSLILAKPFTFYFKSKKKSQNDKDRQPLLYNKMSFGRMRTEIEGEIETPSNKFSKVQVRHFIKNRVEYKLNMGNGN